MLTTFHTICIFARYVYVVLSESLLARFQANAIGKVNSLVIKGGSKYEVPGQSFFEDEQGPKFFPQLYVQRYLTVKRVLEDEEWKGSLRKVVDFGCAELCFFTYLKRLTGVQEILEVDVDRDVLEQHYCRVSPLNSDYLSPRSEPLAVYVLEGSIAHTDEYLVGCDAVVGIELIEHLHPDVLEEIPYTVFGVIKPRVAVFTTPNGEFNVLFPNSEGFRHADHKFEWTRVQFSCWANNIASRYPDYKVSLHGIGWGPAGTEKVGTCSQMAVFERLSPLLTCNSGECTNGSPLVDDRVNNTKERYKLLRKMEYPFHVDTRSQRDKIRDQAEYSLRVLSSTEEFSDEYIAQVPLTRLLPFVSNWDTSVEELEEILKEAGWEFVTLESGCVAVIYHTEESTSSEDPVDCESLCMSYNENQADQYRTSNWSNYDAGFSSEEKWDVDLNCENDSVHESSTIKHIVPSWSELLVKTDGIKNTLGPSEYIPAYEVNNEESEDICSSSTPLNEQVTHEFPGAISPKLCDVTTECSNSYFQHSKLGFQNCSQHAENISDMQCRTNCETDEHEDTNKHGKLSKIGDKQIDCSSPGSSIIPNNGIIQLHSLALNIPHKTSDNKHSELPNSSDEPLHFLKYSPSNSLYLNLQAEVQGTDTNRKQEGQTDSPAAGSISLEEPNDRQADSGYPNSTSAQDMELDLTPEQVDELFTENDVVTDHPPDHHSDSLSVSSRDSDSVNEPQQLHQPPPVVIPQPDVLFEEAMNVENGDVANNNRDDEGNNVIAAIGALRNEGGADVEDDNAAAVGIVLPENLDDLIPLFAAAEDLDNDNEIEINVVEPFPPWLLNLLGLANGGGGIGGVRGEGEDENIHHPQPESSDEEDSDNNPIVDEGLGDEYNLDSSLSDTCPSETGLECDGEIAAANP